MALIAFIAFIALGMSAPAVAADMPVKAKAPPPIVVYDWSGAYVGFSIGGVWTDANRHYPNLGPFGLPLDYKARDSDVIYDFHAGTQWQWGQWVLGVEAGYSAGFREMQSTVALPVNFGANISAYNKVTNLFTVGPRLGFAWDRWMIYGTGGYAIATIKGQYLNTATGLQVSQNFAGQTWNDTAGSPEPASNTWCTRVRWSMSSSAPSTSTSTCAANWHSAEFRVALRPIPPTSARTPAATSSALA